MSSKHLRVFYSVIGGNRVLDVNFNEFLDQELPRQFVSDSSLGVSAQGAQIYSGPPYTAKYIWTINSPVTNLVAQEITDAYRIFEANRAEGGLPTLNVEDETFGDNITALAVFSTPPSISRFGNSPTHVIITFGLTQV